MLVRHGVPRGVREQRMIHRRVVRAILPPDAETDRGGNVVGNSAQRAANFVGGIAELREREVGANRRVAARDVEPDADDGHLLVVRSHSANGHDVPDVPVRHERRGRGA